MSTAPSPAPEYKGIAAFVRNCPYFHLGVGLLGNTLFVMGTVLFIIKQQDAALYLFLLGSSGMFVEPLGEILRVEARHSLRKHDIDPQHPSRRWSEPAG